MPRSLPWVLIPASRVSPGWNCPMSRVSYTAAWVLMFPGRLTGGLLGSIRTACSGLLPTLLSGCLSSCLFVRVASRECNMCSLLQDDVMMPQRVRLQHAAAVRHPTSVSTDVSACFCCIVTPFSRTAITAF